MSIAKLTYTEEEILEIFKEQHRLCSPLDPGADPWVEISPEMSVIEWRWANDLVSWKKLYQFLNQEFSINVSEEAWRAVLEPSRTKLLRGVCRLIAQHAKKDAFQPKTLFGKPCLKAGVFLTLKKNLKQKGVDVTNLKPSSPLGKYLEHYFLPIIEEISLTGAKPIDKITIRRKKKGFWNALNIFDSGRYEILAGEVKTFRDLTEKIIENRNKPD